jgi:hypothetical protein
MTEPVILDSIPFELDPDTVIDRLHLRGLDDYKPRALKLVEQARSVARPRAMYRVAYVEGRTNDTVTVEGVTFTSRVMAVNLEKTHRVLPFVATCGREMEAWAAPITDMLERFWADALMEMAVHAAFQFLNRHISDRVVFGPVGTMDPGSLQDWPLEQQRELFALLGDTQGPVGVELTDSCLMVPVKSVSGICFPSETHYENCQLCPRETCPGRRAPYDSDLYARRYSQHKS